MPLVMIQIEGKAQLQWRANRSASSKRWIGVCDALGLVTEADTLDELHSVIDETIQLVLTDLLRDNELDQFLRERGWKALNVPARANANDVQFNVPWQLVAESTRNPQRRAH